MNDHPDAVELLHIARQTLTDQILPDAKPEHAYALRMIANALGIATREIEMLKETTHREAQSLAALYCEAPAMGDLDQNNRRLARDIRAGKFEKDPDTQQQMMQHLRAVARDKLAAANPRLLRDT